MSGPPIQPQAYGLAIKTRHLKAKGWLLAASFLLARGQANAAIGCWQTALSIEQRNADDFFALGVIAQSRNQVCRAIRCYRAALQRDPGHRQARNNLALAHKQQGKLEQAIALFTSILADHPDFVDAWLNLGNALRLTGSHGQAIACYQSALAREPICVDAWFGLALSHRDSGQQDQALEALQTTLRLQHNHAQALNEAGLLWQDKGQFRLALAYITKALDSQPDNLEIASNLIRLLIRCGQGHDAIQLGRRYVEQGATLPELLTNLALAELAAGDYKNGLLHYESRFDLRHRSVRTMATPACERWDGRPMGSGQQLLLISEQGLGDTLQFIRYVKTLRDHGISVLIGAPDKLHRLIQSSGLADQPLSANAVEQFDNGTWLPLLSLPGLLGVTPQRPFTVQPYLKAGAEATTRWQARLAGEQHPIIALNWHGNQAHDANSLSTRFFELERLAPLFEKAQAAGYAFSLLSLQKGTGSEQLADCSFRHLFVRCQQDIDQCWEFEDMAAIVSHCQLVISCDSVAAHLAAAIGMPTWLLLPKQADWRWGIAGTTSFWYPTVLLFRQYIDSNWDSVFDELGTQLIHVLAAQARDPLHTPLGLGELIDKITILAIKVDQLTGRAQANAQREFSALNAILERLPFTVASALISELTAINCMLWSTEDRLREKELSQAYDTEFLILARSVYLYNDKRAAIKRLINCTYGSALVEEKSYR